MLRSEAITIIKRGLGFRQTQDAAIIAALKQAQRDAELGQTLPNWLLNLGTGLPVAAGATLVTLPTDFIRFHDDYPVQFYTPDNPSMRIFLPRVSYSDVRNVVGGSELGSIPVAYSSEYPSAYMHLNKSTLLLVPAATKAFTLTIVYYAAEPLLDSDIENKWLKYAPNYLAGMAGVHVAGDLRDRGAAEKFNTMARIGQKALMGDIIQEELAGRPLIMGRNN